MRGDTLYGRSRGDTLKIAMATIDRLERQRIDAARTTGVIMGSLAVWLTVALLGGGLE